MAEIILYVLVELVPYFEDLVLVVVVEVVQRLFKRTYDVIVIEYRRREVLGFCLTFSETVSATS